MIVQQHADRAKTHYAAHNDSTFHNKLKISSAQPGDVHLCHRHHASIRQVSKQWSYHGTGEVGEGGEKRKSSGEEYGIHSALLASQ